MIVRISLFYCELCHYLTVSLNTSPPSFDLVHRSVNMKLCLKRTDLGRFSQRKIGRYEGKNVTLLK